MIADEILRYLEEHIEEEGTTTEEIASNEVIIKPPTGTYFFLYIDPSCDVFAEYCDSLEEIVVQTEYALIKRLTDAFLKNCNKAMPRSILADILDVRLRIEPNEGFDNGEAYLWLNKLKLHRVFVLRVVASLLEILEDHPVVVRLEQERQVKIVFSGWGFGYI